MPTKVEQADLNLVLHGRNGESPVVVVAPRSPADAFDMAIEAVRLATKYMVPVYYLSDTYVANGAEPWRVPDVADLPSIEVANRTEVEGFAPFIRDATTLARPWAVPGTPGLEHRIGGIEKADGSGHISYDPANHERMSALRAAKVAGIANDIPPLEVEGDPNATALVVSWGSTYGTVRTAVEELIRRGVPVAHAHLRYLNPMPANTEEVLARYAKVVVTELNMGQLNALLRARFLVDTVAVTKIQGQPFKVAELVARIGDGLTE